jgi:beta-lactamase superfamily II metal-dependent hydrolase
MVSLLLAAVLGFAADEPRGLDIYFVDVQGGAATLIVTPERESILIDSGWPGFDDRDPKRIVYVLKEVAGLDHLDHLVTTHWHIDHFGGVEGLAKRIEIAHFWDRGLPEDGIAGLDFPDGPKADDPLGVAYRKASAGKRTALKAGDTLPLRGDAKAVVVVSGKNVIDAHGEAAHCADAPPDKEPDPSDNARSLGLIVRLGRFDFLDLGDLTWNVEKTLVCPVDRLGKVDLYQVTHHGMDISNHPTLVKSVEPTVAVMNNGPRKGGSPATVKLLKSLPSLRALYAVHKNQATGPVDNADPALTANADPEGGQFIHVHVEPDGSRFSVRIGTDGERREYEAR